MDADTLAALVAFFALGANALGTTFLLLADPRSRAIRWFALFEADIMLWLALQGWIFARGEVGSLGPWFEGAVHMLPGLFLATSLVDVRGWSDRRALAVTLAWAALLPLAVGALVDSPGTPAWFFVAQTAGWTSGAVLHARDRSGRERPGVSPRLRTGVLVVLLVVGPLAVVLGWLSGSGDFFVFAMPLLTVAIQILLLIGVLHLRFYDIEVRAARGGRIAARATELERLAIVGELAASFAHEVRNPLTGVRSLAQRLAEDEVDEERRRRYADVIVKEVGRVEGIVARLLGIARRPTPAETEPVDLASLFDDLALVVSGVARQARVEVRTDAGGIVASAATDPLVQALLNLLLNAIAHSPEGGRVDLVAARDGDAALVLVRDEGSGVPEAEREKVFQPLYSLTGGSGLGLAIVRRTAEEHGWRVSVGEAPGGGAEFRLRVPVAEAVPAGDAA